MYQDNPALGTREAYVPGLTKEYVAINGDYRS